MSLPKVIFIILILLSILGFRFYLFYQSQPHYFNGQKITLQITLQEDPVITAGGQQFSIKTPSYQTIRIKTSSMKKGRMFNPRILIVELLKQYLLSFFCFFSSYLPIAYLSALDLKFVQRKICHSGRP